MPQASPIVVDGLDHSFGSGDLRKQILFGINTEIPAGQIVIVTGPSGSGKTTLLTIVGALRSAQSGSVRGPARAVSAEVRAGFVAAPAGNSPARLILLTLTPAGFLVRPLGGIRTARPAQVRPLRGAANRVLA